MLLLKVTKYLIFLVNVGNAKVSFILSRSKFCE